MEKIELVKGSEKLLEFDIPPIKAAGYDVTTAVLVSEPEQVEAVKTGDVKELEKLLKTS